MTAAKQTSPLLAQGEHAPTDRSADAEVEAIADPVEERKREVEETLEALKSKVTHATGRIDDTTDFVRDHRWIAVGAAASVGLFLGMRRPPAPTVQVVLPPGQGGEVSKPKRSLLGAALQTAGLVALRAVATRVVEQIGRED